jgi:hypothetical protein
VIARISYAFTEGTMRIATLRTVSAETPMTQKGQFLLADSFSHKNPWQHKIQNRYVVVEAACGHSQKRNVSKVGH